MAMSKTLILTLALVLIAATMSEARHHKRIKTFYAYNYLSIKGANSTSGYNTVQCGGPTPPEPAMFGTVYCFDMPLLKTQDVKGELLGTVQGTFVITKIGGGSIYVSETFIFNGTNDGLPAHGSFSAAGMENIGKLTAKPITGGTEGFAYVTGVAFTTPLGSGIIDSYGNNFFWFKYKFTFH